MEKSAVKADFDHYENLHVDGMIILKGVLWK
jgi:hypothetical protein